MKSWHIQTCNKGIVNLPQLVWILSTNSICIPYTNIFHPFSRFNISLVYCNGLFIQLTSAWPNTIYALMCIHILLIYNVYDTTAYYDINNLFINITIFKYYRLTEVWEYNIIRNITIGMITEIQYYDVKSFALVRLVIHRTT